MQILLLQLLLYLFSWRKEQALDTLSKRLSPDLLFFFLIEAIVCLNKEKQELFLAVCIIGMRAQMGGAR